MYTYVSISAYSSLPTSAAMRYSVVSALILCLHISHTLSQHRSKWTATQENMNLAGTFFQAASADFDKNYVISPCNMQIALGILQQGSRRETQHPISKYLSSNPSRNAQYTELLNATKNKKSLFTSTNMGNQAYLSQAYTIKPSFVSELRQSFNSSIKSVDFNNALTPVRLSNWAKTTSKMTTNSTLFTEVGNDASLVLVSAAYFRGRWIAERLRYDYFYPERPYISYQQRYVQIGTKCKYRDVEQLDAGLLEMPFEDGKTSMLLFLPSIRQKLNSLQEKIKSNSIKSFLSSLQQYICEISIPAFRIESILNLRRPLEKLGIHDVFSQHADLSEMSQSPESPYVSNAVHLAVVDIAPLSPSSLRKFKSRGKINSRHSSRKSTLHTDSIMDGAKREITIVNRSFLFYILRQTESGEKIVLFSGRVVKPDYE